MAGRPKPTALKVLNGNPGKRPLPEFEPQVPDGEIAPVAPLSGAAKEAWDKLAKLLSDMNVLTIADAIALQELCLVYAELTRIRTSLAADDLVYTSDSNVSRPNPLATMLSDTDKRLRAWLVEFGLTPASRARIQVGKNADGSDPWDEFM